MFKAILSRPFHYYTKGASIGFGFTFLTNQAVGMVNPEPPVSLYATPKLFTTINLGKSLQHAALFPVIPFCMIQNPKGFFIVGQSLVDVGTILEELDKAN